jgi:hypothetical protein
MSRMNSRLNRLSKRLQPTVGTIRVFIGDPDQKGSYKEHGDTSGKSYTNKELEKLGGQTIRVRPKTFDEIGN